MAISFQNGATSSPRVGHLDTHAATGFMCAPIDAGTEAFNQFAKPRAPQVGMGACRMKEILIEGTDIQWDRPRDQVKG